MGFSSLTKSARLPSGGLNNGFETTPESSAPKGLPDGSKPGPRSSTVAMPMPVDISLTPREEHGQYVSRDWNMLKGSCRRAVSRLPFHQVLLRDAPKPLTNAALNQINVRRQGGLLGWVGEGWLHLITLCLGESLVLGTYVLGI